MLVWRTVLAVCVALAVAVAPVRAAFARADTGAVSDVSAKSHMHDCGGATHSPASTNDADDKCPGDGSKCCKLMGTISLPSGATILLTPILARTEPDEPAGWRLQPLPPPPRT